MKTIVNPTATELLYALARPKLSSANLEGLMEELFSKIETSGDEGLNYYSLLFDKVQLTSLEVADQEWKEAENVVSEELKTAIQTAAKNIERFHRNQMSQERELETTEGVVCWRKSVAIQQVGLYIPGGTAPLFSTVLMLGIPAQIAGSTAILCSPPSSNGTIHPAILYAAKVAGISRVFKVGGAQAIAAMCFGTETIPQVNKIFGPGNQYVTAAKMYAQRFGVAIDMPAGPSEVLVAVDASISPAIVASDLLAQAEHGSDSQVILLTDTQAFVELVNQEIDRQLIQLPRAEIAKSALLNSTAIVSSPKIWSEIINQYAPEHLIVMGKYENELIETVVNAGSVFIGAYSAESFGDYASGTNHTLPTAGFAKAYSGISLDSFVKKITYQRVNEKGLKNLGQTVITLAEAEELQAHANAIKIRQIEILKTNSVNLEKRELTSENIERFIRKDLKNIVPYSSARGEFEGKDEVFLDANENGLLQQYNRYPDPLQLELKKTIAVVKEIPKENLFLGNGSDEVLDLIFRLTTTPFLDSVSYLNPSYGMYSVLAKINGLQTKEINLDKEFGVSVETILQVAAGTKLLIICNPNNPTGGVISKQDLIEIVEQFKGIVVVDEAYVDFCPAQSLKNEVTNYSNLIVVQTLSKAYGMAGLRVGMAIASSPWIKALNTIKPPYNLSSIVQQTAIDILQTTQWEEVKSTICSERERVSAVLKAIPAVEKVFASTANFILFRIKNANKVYDYLSSNGVVVRNRSTQFNCENTLRVSIGNEEENNRFIELMKTV